MLVLNQLEEPERWSTYFMKLDDVKFRKKVVPGMRESYQMWNRSRRSATVPGSR